MSSPESRFNPPTLDQIREHLQRAQPRPSMRPGPVLMGMAAAVLVIWFIAGDQPIAVFTPWLMLIGVMIWLAMRGRQMQTLQQESQHVAELAMLRQFADALRQAWRLLPRLVHAPQEHGQVVMVMGSVLLTLRAYEPATYIFDYLLDHMPGDHPGSHWIRAQRAMALLHMDRLADADDALRSLRSAELGPIESAMFTTAQLYQSIKTHHHDDVIEQADKAVERLRPLGVDAALGYAMIAAAFAHRENDAGARSWWHTATLLLPPSSITYALPETQLLTALPPSPSLASLVQQAASQQPRGGDI